MPRLKEHPPAPLPVPAFDAAPDVWSAIRAGDILVHHPYQSFDVVTRFVEEAALDPKVLAIKMTLYRVSPTSPIAQALTKAAERGKEVAVLVELKARFDEEANIRWARALEAVGAHVVYGLPNFKTHCKACLVVRQEAEGIRRYCHLATGNYNAKTGGPLRRLRPLHLPRLVRRGPDGALQPAHRLHAPAARCTTCSWRRRGCARGSSSESGARRRTRARGAAATSSCKMNSLVDPVLIDELYEASRAGVDIDAHRAGHLLPAARRCRACRSASASSRSSTATSSTRACSRSTTRASPRSSSRRPTGCRATSTTGSRSRSRSSIPRSASRCETSWRCSSRTP